MFKKTMKFDDLDGNEVERTFYFNFNKKEIAELLEFGAIQKFADPNKQYLPLEEAMKRLSTPVEESGLSQTENNRQAYAIFQDLILDAYGEKGEDNVTFKKTQELRDFWESHVAYVELIFEFLGDERLAAQFFENCLPPRMVNAAKEDLQKEGKLTSTDLLSMVEEAERRQNDPATAIEPGTDLNAADGGVPETKVEDLTALDIEQLDDIAFKKLDVKRLSPEALQAAFYRKTKS